MKVIGAVGFIKPRISLTFSVVDNRLIFCTINPTGKPDKNHNNKNDK